MDIGTWSRKSSLTKDQLDERQRLFTEYQKAYNDTGDTSIVWLKMRPLIKDSIRSNILKINKFNFVEDFDDKVEDGLLLVIDRYIKNPTYNFSSLPTLGYWAAIYACRRKDIVNREKYSSSYEELIDEKLLHEEEHILNLEDYESYSWVDGLY